MTIWALSPGLALVSISGPKRLRRVPLAPGQHQLGLQSSSELPAGARRGAEDTPLPGAAAAPSGLAGICASAQGKEGFLPGVRDTESAWRNGDQRSQ
jgi:hypothetical protein